MERAQTFQVFVISLDRAVERREYMRSLISDLGFNATIISAVDGKNLGRSSARYNSERAQRIYGCEMNDNEIACYLSHLSIYSKMLEQRIDTALILEDDISCVRDLKPIVDEVLKLPKTSWQVVRLQSTKSSVSNPTKARGVGEPVARVGRARDLPPADQRAWRMRLPDPAQRCRVPCLPRSETIDMPIDQTLDRYWENGIIPYVLRPMPVWHEELFHSEIGQRGRAVEKRNLRVVLRRRLQRGVDALNSGFSGLPSVCRVWAR